MVTQVLVVTPICPVSRVLTIARPLMKDQTASCNLFSSSGYARLLCVQGQARSDVVHCTIQGTSKAR